MKRKGLRLNMQWKALLTVFLLWNALAAAAMPIGTAFAADDSNGYQVQITESISSSGFKHPGVGLTKDILENMREEVLAHKEPWYSYYVAMTASAAASQTITSNNQSSTDPTKPAVTVFDSQSVQSRFIADALKAYTQALMYYINGDEVYRANAMRIIRIWSQMDPTKYKYYTDAHIHSGVPLNRMVTAAEILRYSSYQDESLKWTEKDTADFTNNLINPIIETLQHDNSYFMNQHSYPLMGAMAGYIFTDNVDRYKEAVEWFTVNSTANDQGFNGAIKQLFRLVETNDKTGEAVADPQVQQVEMGRDQAHGGGDLTNAAIISRMLLAQGTKVDPVEGTVSTASNAVGIYEFLNDRILAAADYFWRFMLGYDTPWTPVAYAISPDGTIRDTYDRIANGYRGRYNTTNFWDLFYYYTYVRGEDLSKKAPYYYEAFMKRTPANFYYGGSLNVNWDNVDAGTDFWLYIPKAAEAEGAAYLPKPMTSGTVLEVEDRYTKLDDNTSTLEDNGVSFVRFTATQEGSRIAYLSGSTGEKTIGFKIRTNGIAQLKLSPGINDTMILPDTKGQWQYVTYSMNQFQGVGDILYLEVTGAGTTVDLDHINVKGSALTPPKFTAAGNETRLYSVVDVPMNIDLSATDTNAADVLTYDGADLPQGASLNASTGAFTWQAAAPGEYAFTVWASDGTTVTARHVVIVVSNERTAAIAAASSSYNDAEIYVRRSLDQYQAAYDATEAMKDTAADDEFYTQLQVLREAADNLALVTPRLADDGSIDYPDIVQTSSFANTIKLLVDGDPQTQAYYSLAPGLYHTIDFGADYKVAASAFGFQSFIFSDRIANSTVFGSNDGVSWTRLTPGVTRMTQDFQKIEVADEYKDKKFRFFKIQLLQPLPDVLYGVVRNLMEVSEFRIYGTRYETDNKIESASLSSPKALNGKIAVGDPATLTFKAREAIKDVNVTIQGVSAAVTTTDNINFTASAALTGSVQTGTVSFTLNYNKADGTAGDPVFVTTDNSKLFLAGDRSKFLNVPLLAKVVASDRQWGNGTVLSAEQIGYLLFDGNTATFGDLNTGAGSYYTIDFGAAKVKLTDALLMPRSGYPARLNGTVLQGSNDNTNWTTLNAPLAGNLEGTWAYLQENQLLAHEYYRYIRIYNDTAWSGDVAEVELYGDIDFDSDYLDSKVLPQNGYTEGSYYQYLIEVNRIKAEGKKPGANKNVLLAQLTNAQNLLVPLTSLYPRINVTQSMVVASTVSYDGKADAALNGWRAFDGDVNTFTDTKNSAGWVNVDLGAGNEKVLGSIRYIPRTGNAVRMNGAQIQGSNDGINYDTLATINGVGSVTWYSQLIDNQTTYRHYRYNAPAGNTNVADIELYEYRVDATLLTLLIQQAYAVTAGQYSDDSYAALQTALSAAQPVAANASSSQSEVDAAASILKTALESLVEKSASLNGPVQATAGDAIQVVYGVQGVGGNFDPIQAFDVTLDFDPSKLTLTSIKPKDDKVMIERQELAPGQVRIIAAITGEDNAQASTETLLTFGFDVNAALGNTDAAIAVSGVRIANSQGEELALAGAEHHVLIKPIPTDKSVLDTLITQAQAKYNAAVEGYSNGQYLPGAKATLQSAITAARTVNNNSDAAQAEINAAVTSLNDALSRFGSRMVVLDLNGDSSISIGDLARAAAGYGVSMNDSNWSSYAIADVNKDGTIDITDLSIIARAILE